jgi:hypothetical protein
MAKSQGVVSPAVLSIRCAGISSRSLFPSLVEFHVPALDPVMLHMVRGKWRGRRNINEEGFVGRRRILIRPSDHGLIGQDA